MNNASASFLYVCVLFFSLMLSSCSSRGGRTVYLRPLEGGEQNISIKYHHLSADTTRVYYSIPTRYMVCERDPQDLSFHGRCTLSCEFYSPASASQILFAVSHVIEVDTMRMPPVAFVGYFDAPVPSGQTYMVKNTVTDGRSPQKNSILSYVDKKNPYNSSMFLLRDSTGAVLFDNFTSSQDTVSIHMAQGNHQYIYVTRYNSQTRMPAPAYIIGHDDTEKFKADTTFVIENGEKVVFSPQGLYVLRTDTTHTKGYCLLSLYKGFPAVSQSQALVSPMRYICSDTQYDAIRYSPTYKLSVEKEWVNTAGSLPAAQRLISAYYSRVEYANRHFSSYKEGSETDRGMIYILYGPPSKVYTAPHSQRWVYGHETSALDVSFVFDRMNNPFSEEVYVLQRNLNKKNIWSRAVAAWRDGTVFDNNEVIKIQDEYDRQRYYDTYRIWY